MKPNTPNIDVSEIRKMLAAATPGKWTYAETDYGHVIRMGSAIENPYNYDSQHEIQYDHGCYYDDDEEENDAENGQAKEAEANAALIAKAPETISALCDENESMREEIAAMQNVIKQQDELIDSANNAIETLNSELDFARRENERLRKALEWYADKENYKSEFIEHGHDKNDHYYEVPEVMDDEGNRAREALRRDTPNGHDNAL